MLYVVSLWCSKTVVDTEIRVPLWPVSMTIFDLCLCLHMYPSLCLCVFVYFCVSLSVSVSASASVSVSVCMSVCMPVSVSVSVSVSMSESVYLCIYVCACVCVCVCVCVSHSRAECPDVPCKHIHIWFSPLKMFSSASQSTAESLNTQTKQRVSTKLLYVWGVNPTVHKHTDNIVFADLQERLEESMYYDHKWSDYQWCVL